MSMHEIEDLVEASVRCLDASRTPGLDHRSLFHTLYAWQSQYDCSHTLGRVHDIVLRHRYLYELPLEAHPDHARLGKKLVSKDGWIMQRAGEPWDKRKTAHLPGVVRMHATFHPTRVAKGINRFTKQPMEFRGPEIPPTVDVEADIALMALIWDAK